MISNHLIKNGFIRKNHFFKSQNNCRKKDKNIDKSCYRLECEEFDANLHHLFYILFSLKECYNWKINVIRNIFNNQRQKKKECQRINKTQIIN